MLYCGKPPKEKYKKTGENIKKHDLFIYFYLFLSIFLSAPTAQLLLPNSRYFIEKKNKSSQGLPVWRHINIGTIGNMAWRNHTIFPFMMDNS